MLKSHPNRLRTQDLGLKTKVYGLRSIVYSLWSIVHGRERGFTLIEMVMTMIIVGIVSIPLSLLIGAHIESVLLSERDVMAENLGRYEMEKVNNMAYANISTASFSNYEGYAYDLTRTVTYVQGDGASAESLKKVVVEVREAGGTAVIVRAVTYLAKNVVYGL